MKTNIRNLHNTEGRTKEYLLWCATRWNELTLAFFCPFLSLCLCILHECELGFAMKDFCETIQPHIGFFVVSLYGIYFNWVSVKTFLLQLSENKWEKHNKMYYMYSNIPLGSRYWETDVLKATKKSRAQKWNGFRSFRFLPFLAIWICSSLNCPFQQNFLVYLHWPSIVKILWVILPWDWGRLLNINNIKVAGKRNHFPGTVARSLQHPFHFVFDLSVYFLFENLIN